MEIFSLEKLFQKMLSEFHRRNNPPKRRFFKQQSNIKSSLGIACVKFIKNRPHILMICKRYTYAFDDFVKGKYSHVDPKKSKKSREELMALFDNMTVEEKLAILSLDFSYIWYKVWLNNSKGPYHKYKSIFDSMFLADGGAKLKYLISKSACVSKIWEIPKGKKVSYSEPDIYCAIREFKEETGIPKKAYYIYPDIKKTTTHSDNGIIYNSTYYLGIAKHNLKPTIDFNNPDQLGEISDMKWMTIEEVKMIDDNRNLTEFVKRMFKIAKKMRKLPS